MKITNDIKYVGVNDHLVDLFEGQFIVPDGMSYNSYVICDEKIAVMDSVGGSFGQEWINNIKSATDGKDPDYLIVSHMEPDHSGNIAYFKECFPNAVIVASEKAFSMMAQFFGNDYAETRIVAAEGDSLCLGKHTLSFITAPMVHWPEVIMSYDSFEKVLFSADAFGKFGALDTEDDDWACEARRYYFGIVGKYGAQVQTVLKKAANLDINKICPLHGPVLSQNLEYYLNLYNTWSSYEAEEKGVVVAYTSVYGGTKKAAELAAEKLTENGCPKVVLNDLARCDMAEAVEDAFRYDRLILATTTYNGEIFPFMKQFIDALTERNYQKRKIGIIENGTWVPVAAKVIKQMFEKSKDIEFASETVTIKSVLNDESETQLDALVKEMC